MYCGSDEMASNNVKIKKRCLKKGHHLIGRDMLTVIKMLQDFEASVERWKRNLGRRRRFLDAKGKSSIV